MARLPPITGKEQVAETHHDIVDAITRSRGAIQGPFTMFLHCPELAGRVAHLGAYVRFEGAFPLGGTGGIDSGATALAKIRAGA